MVLFSWAQFLKEEALAFLDIHNVLELPSDGTTCNVSPHDPESMCDTGYEKTLPSKNSFKNISDDSDPVDEKKAQQADNKNEGGTSLLLRPNTELLQNKGQTLSGLTPSQILLSQILIYQADQKQKVFASTLFECGVCFTSSLGSECMQLSECDHIFCQACLSEFCRVQITNGNVRGLTCPQADCTATPTPSQVLQCFVFSEMCPVYVLQTSELQVN